MCENDEYYLGKKKIGFILGGGGVWLTNLQNQWQHFNEVLDDLFREHEVSGLVKNVEHGAVEP